MSMKPSDFTVAVRQLVSVYPDITHEQARPLLEELGIEVVAKPGRISADASAIKEYEVKKLEDVKAALEAEDYDLSEHPRLASKVYKEYQTRDAFAKEANQFNVSKSNFKQGKGGKASDLPALPTAVAQKVEALKGGEEPTPTKKRRGRRKTAQAPAAPKVSGDKFDSITEMLALVKKHGGVQGASQRVAALQAEIAELESAIRVAEAAVKAA